MKKKLEDVEASMKPGETKFFQSDKGPAYIKKAAVENPTLFKDTYTPARKAKVISKYGYESYSKGKRIE